MSYNEDINPNENIYLNEIYSVNENANFFISSYMNFNPTNNGIENNTLNQILNVSLYDRCVYKDIIKEDVKKQLIAIKYKNFEKKKDYPMCFISYIDFQDDDEIIQLPCEHCFESSAIIHWLTEEAATCPICRYKFPSQEKKITIDASLNINDVSSNNVNNLDDFNGSPYLIPLNLNSILYNIQQIMYSNNIYIDDNANDISDTTDDL